MNLTQERYTAFDSLLDEIIKGLAVVAIAGAAIILIVAIWGIITIHYRLF